MKPFKGKVSQTTTHNKEYKIVTNDKICEPYWDDCGWSKYKRTGLYKYQYRRYRNWKYNRKTQWL